MKVNLQMLVMKLEKRISETDTDIKTAPIKIESVLCNNRQTVDSRQLQIWKELFGQTNG